METTKPFEISKHDVVRAWELVKANDGAEGVDGETIEQFESNLKGNLYKIWNRLSSGSYFPPPSRAIVISKKDGGERSLGIPSVSDRVAQTVVKLSFEPLVEPYFLGDSYGYRPGKSAHQALDITRKRCWRYDWVLEFDIRGMFDNIDHQLLMKAVKKHTSDAWLLLYIERWITAPVQQVDGSVVARDKGVQQGGVISPVLSNLFMHYAFDEWLRRNHPSIQFARYADDAVVHARSQYEAETLLAALRERLAECGLELHPEKTKIVYCKDDDRRGTHEHTSFDFLGYTFRPRRAKNRWGKLFISFLPGVSNKAAKSIRATIRSWRLGGRRNNQSLEEIAKFVNPFVRGWVNYYGRFYPSALTPVLRSLERSLVYWVRRKFKRFRYHQRKAVHWLGRVAQREPRLFALWAHGIRPATGR